MGRRRKTSTPLAEGEELRNLMRRCQDDMRQSIARGYGDERNRVHLDQLREHARTYEKHDGAMWAEVAAEKRVKRYSEEHT